MPLKVQGLAFPFFLGTIAAVNPLSIDISLPTIPAVASFFGADVIAVQLTMTAFFAGLAIGQLVYGPLSDRFGRRPLLIAGLSLCLAGTLLCASAGSVDTLIAGRLLQAFGAASATVLTRSIVRDLYAWNEAARTLALMHVIFGIVPIVGPVAGSLLLIAWGWESVFWLVAAITAALLVWVALRLPETAPYPRAGAPSPAAIGRNFGFLLGERHFLAYMLAVLFIQAGIFAFVGGSSIVLIKALGYSAKEYGVVYALIMVGHITGAAWSSRLVLKQGIDRTIRLGALISFGSGGVLALLAWLHIGSALAIVIPMFCFMFGTTLIVPHATAAAMSPYPKIAGAASSLIGFGYLAAGAGMSYALGAIFDGTARPLTTAIALTGLVTLALYELLIRRLKPHASRTAR